MFVSVIDVEVSFVSVVIVPELEEEKSPLEEVEIVFDCD